MKLLMLGLLVLTACNGGEKVRKRGTAPNGSAATQTASSSSDTTTTAADSGFSANLTIKNCDQILRTMEKLTGHSRLSANVQTMYMKVKGSCPTETSLDSLDGSKITAINNIAFEFCQGYVDGVIKKGGVAGIDVSKAPLVGITDAGLDALYSDFYSRFYLGPRTGIPPLESIKKTVDPVIKDIRASVGATTATGVASEAIIRGACGMVLSSAPVITQ
jgi:hypothetical protein